MVNLINSIRQSLRIWLSIPETENTFYVGTSTLATDRDRPAYSSEEILLKCIGAWRFNPLARRIAELTTQYAVGNGFNLNCEDGRVKTFTEEFWNHRLNQMNSRILAMSDELAHCGNLFLLISTDFSG